MEFSCVLFGEDTRTRHLKLAQESM